MDIAPLELISMTQLFNMSTVDFGASLGKSPVWEQKSSTDLLDAFMTLMQMNLSEMMRSRMNSAWTQHAWKSKTLKKLDSQSSQSF